MAGSQVHKMAPLDARLGPSCWACAGSEACACTLGCTQEALGLTSSWSPPGHSQASVGIQRADNLAQKLMPDLDARAQGVVLRDLQRGAV